MEKRLVWVKPPTHLVTRSEVCSESECAVKEADRKETRGRKENVFFPTQEVEWTVFIIRRAYVSLTLNKPCNTNIILGTYKCRIGNFQWMHKAKRRVQKRYKFSLDFYILEGLNPTTMAPLVIFLFCSLLEVCFFQLLVFLGGMRSGSYCSSLMC